MSSRTVKITYGIDDGYAGGDRPQTFNVELNEFDGVESHDDLVQTLSELIGEDFAQRISWTADLGGLADKIRAELTKGSAAGAPSVPS